MYPILLSLALGAGALAILPSALQGQHAGHASGTIPREILERPIALRAGIGTVHSPVTTRSAQAQAFYDQGMALLATYSYLDAARSFHQALRHDPELAMAYAGLSSALASLDMAEAARSADARALALAPRASPREQRRLALRARAKGPRDEYLRAVEEALAADPDDIGLWVVRGQLEPSEVGLAYLDTAAVRAPGHPSPHHQIVHGAEAAGRFDLALEHGEILARLAPAVPHARHMYGHALVAANRVDDAVREFAAVDSMEQAYHAAEQIPPQYDWHHPHNVTVLAKLYQFQGRMAEAERLARRRAALPHLRGEDTLVHRIPLAELLLDRGRAQEALPLALEVARASDPHIRGMGALLAAHARLELGGIDEARAHLAEAEAAIGGVPFLKVALDELRGVLWLSTDRRSDGAELLRTVLARLREQVGPDARVQALFRMERIARLAQDRGEWALAEEAARQMIAHNPEYAGGHLVLAQVAGAYEDRDAAARSLREAARLWSVADPEVRALVSAADR